MTCIEMRLRIIKCLLTKEKKKENKMDISIKYKKILKKELRIPKINQHTFLLIKKTFDFTC